MLLAVELLLFEWRPRSVVPVALAAATAEVVREVFAAHGLLRAAPLFAMHAAGALPHAVAARRASSSARLRRAGLGDDATVYAAEDLFTRLPLHWSWWPALGGLVVGVGGLIEPRVLGVGYDTISDKLAGRLAIGALVVLLGVQAGRVGDRARLNTSGGILAPLLMMGAAVGAILGAPAARRAGGHLRAARDGGRAGRRDAVAADEHRVRRRAHPRLDALLPLLVACTVAHLASVLVLRRSILTEKIARRGYHVNREYERRPAAGAVRPRRDVHRRAHLRARDTTLHELYEQVPEGSAGRRQRLYPVLDDDGALEGVLAWSDVLAGQGHRRCRARPRGSAWRSPAATRRCATPPTAWSSRATACCRSSTPPTRAASSAWSTSSTCCAPTRRALVEERHRERPLATRLAALPRPLHPRRRLDRLHVGAPPRGAERPD